MAVASECKAILAFPGFPREIDPQALSDYLSLMYVPAPKSIYRHIRKLPAGHWMRVDAGGGLTIRKWWDLEFPDHSEFDAMDEEAAAGLLRDALEESVRGHMESDVPLGAFLSGGVDSAAVVALMARHSSQAIRTNTIRFGHKGFDEGLQAAATAAALHTDHREFQVEPDAASILDKLAWFYDEPFADSSMIPTYYVCQMARQNVTVALSGDGGDESFAGYRRYRYDLLENRVRAALPALPRRLLFGALGAAYPRADWLPQPLRAKTLLRNLSYSPVQGYFTTMSHLLPRDKARLLGGDMRRALGGYDSMSVFEEHWRACGSRDPLSRVQYLDFKTYLVDDILVKVDRASMAHSLEVRVPVLDHVFVEMAARMPSRWKLRGREGKHIFKRSLRGVVPDEVFTRPKTGFSIPLAAWLRKDMAEYARGHLLEGPHSLANLGLVEKRELQRLWDDHASGLKDNAYILFALLSLATWHKTFIRPA